MTGVQTCALPIFDLHLAEKSTVRTMSATQELAPRLRHPAEREDWPASRRRVTAHPLAAGNISNAPSKQNRAMTPTNEIRIAAGLLVRGDGCTLLVRKRGSTAFIQPGGKIEADEEPIDALRRELFEELGLRIEAASAKAIGQFSAPAVNEPGCVVTAVVFRVLVDTEVVVGAEIEEAVWIQVNQVASLNIAPLTRDHLLPLLGG